MKSIHGWLKQSFNICRNNIWDTLFVLFIVVNIFARLGNFENKYFLGVGDSSRDYLVARHIVKYQEYPLVGPWNSVYDSLRNSPVYYYALALLVAVRDDLLFLGVVNIVLQAVVVLLVYALAKEMFSPPTALAASTIYGLSALSFNQSSFLWQPFFSLPFAWIGYWLLWKGFLRSDHWYLIGAVGIEMVAAALHFSVLAILPAFLLLTCLFLWSTKPRPWQWVFFGIFILLASAGLFLPVVEHLFRNRAAGSLIEKSLYIGTPVELLENFIQNISTFFGYFLFYGHNFSPIVLKGATAATLLLFGAYQCIQKDRTGKARFWILLSFIFFPLLLASFIKKPIYDHFFTPLYGLLAIAIAETLHGFIPKKLNAVKVFLVLLLTYFASDKLFNFRFDGAYENLTTVRNAALAMRNVVTLKQKDDKVFSGNFIIEVYKKGDGRTHNDSIFWTQLELLTGNKYTQVVNYGNSYVPLNTDGYIFLVCQRYVLFKDAQNECLQKFHADFPHHVLIVPVYAQDVFEIFLTQKRPVLQ